MILGMESPNHRAPVSQVRAPLAAYNETEKQIDKQPSTEEAKHMCGFAV
jgi:hypothetical protein